MAIRAIGLHDDKRVFVDQEHGVVVRLDAVRNIRRLIRDDYIDKASRAAERLELNSAESALIIPYVLTKIEERAKSGMMSGVYILVDEFGIDASTHLCHLKWYVIEDIGRLAANGDINSIFRAKSQFDVKPEEINRYGPYIKRAVPGIMFNYGEIPLREILNAFGMPYVALRAELAEGIGRLIAMDRISEAMLFMRHFYFPPKERSLHTHKVQGLKLLARRDPRAAASAAKRLRVERSEYMQDSQEQA